MTRACDVHQSAKRLEMRLCDPCRVSFPFGIRKQYKFASPLEESRRPGMARLLAANFRQGDSVFLSIGGMEAFELPYNANREIIIPPEATEIFLIHKESGKTDFKRQLAVFHFKADHNYTGIISPSGEIPSRPTLRISDSNQDWKGLRSSKLESKGE